jgi:hypothetical protein
MGIVLLENSFLGVVQLLQEWARIAGRIASQWEACNMCEHHNGFKGEGAGAFQLADNHQ